MSVKISFDTKQSSAYFKEQKKKFVLNLYCYDGSLEEMQKYQDKIRLSFDQVDKEGHVLKDGNTFEMELDINQWQDVAEREATYSELIDTFIDHLGEIEKKWLKNFWQKSWDNLSISS